MSCGLADWPTFADYTTALNTGVRISIPTPKNATCNSRSGSTTTTSSARMVASLTFRHNVLNGLQVPPALFRKWHILFGDRVQEETAK
jgi:hypothetical protein